MPRIDGEVAGYVIAYLPGGDDGPLIDGEWFETVEAATLATNEYGPGVEVYALVPIERS